MQGAVHVRYSECTYIFYTSSNTVYTCTHHIGICTVNVYTMCVIVVNTMHTLVYVFCSRGTRRARRETYTTSGTQPGLISVSVPIKSIALYTLDCV